MAFNSAQPHQRQAAKAFSVGAARHGLTVTDKTAGADLVVGWGRAPGDRPKLLLEAGYINGSSGDYTADRLRFISTSWNQMHGQSESFLRCCPPDRFAKLKIQPQPWRKARNDPAVLVCEQIPTDAAAPDPVDWNMQIDRIQRKYRHVTLRKHPRGQKNIEPLSDALFHADLMITYASTSAVESILAGVPTIALGSRCVVKELCGRSLGEIRYPRREPFLYNLAYRQWTLSEFESGRAWDHLRLELDQLGQSA